MSGSLSQGQPTFGEDLLVHAYKAMSDAAEADPKRAAALLRMVAGTWARSSKREKICAERNIAVPSVIFLSITGDCNLRCPHCYARGYPRKHMPLELAARIVSEGCQLGALLFVITGGEPLLYPEFFAIVRDMPDVPFLIFTNGTRVPAFLADGGATPNMLWAVSIDGPKQWNDARRGEVRSTLPVRRLPPWHRRTCRTASPPRCPRITSSRPRPRPTSSQWRRGAAGWGSSCSR